MALQARATEQLEAKVKALGKLPENRACINCGSKGSQSVCITFSTFVCIPCSGIHREFTHRIKSMSMSKWTPEEVRALQEGGNETARQIYFKDWDPSKFPVPDNSNPERLRSFIKAVYVDKRFTGELSVSNVRERRASDPRDASSPHSSTGYSPRYSPREADRYAGSGAGGERFTSKESPNDKPKKRGLFRRFSGSPRTSDDRSRTSSEKGSRRGSEERSQSAEQSPRYEPRGVRDVRDVRSSYDEREGRVDTFPVARASWREERPQSPPIQPIEAVLGPDTPKLRLAGEPNYKDGPNSPGFLRGPPNKGGALEEASSGAAHRREKSAALIDFNFDDEPAAAPSTTPADPFGAPAPAGDAGTGAWATFGDAPAFEAAGSSGGGFADANAGWNAAGGVGGGPSVQPFPGPGNSQGSGDWNTFSNRPPQQQSGWGFAPQHQPGLAPFPAHFGAFPGQQGFSNPGQFAPYPPQQGHFPHQNQLPPSGNFYPPAQNTAQGPPQAVAPTSQGLHANGTMAPQGPPSTSGGSTGGGISKIGALPDDLFSEKGGPPNVAHVFQPPQYPAYAAPLQQYAPMPQMPGYAAPPKSRNPFDDPPPSGPGGGPPAQPFNFGPLSNALPNLGPPSFGLPGSQGAPASKSDPFGGSGGFQQTNFGPQFPNNTGGNAGAVPSSHGGSAAARPQGGTQGNPF